MFKYTKASINILVEDVKRYAKIFKYISLVFTLCFLTFQIVTKFLSKNYVLCFINVFLFLLFTVFTILDFIFERNELKTSQKVAKRIYKWTKIITKMGTLVITIIEIWNTPPGQISGISIILATLMILLWILSFVAEIVVEIVTDKSEELLVAWKQDVEDIKRPITAVTNTFRKITGKTIPVDEENPKKTKILSKLNDRIIQDKIKDEDEDEE